MILSFVDVIFGLGDLDLVIAVMRVTICIAKIKNISELKLF